MKPGDEYNCPHCGKNSFLKKEAVMDGWTKKGEVLKCAACGCPVCELKPESSGQSADPLKSAAADRLKNLFGTGDWVQKPTLKAEGSETNFCKDCAFLIPHPFVFKCSRFNKTVSPMEDCPEFQRRGGAGKK